MICQECKMEVKTNQYFCMNCGAFLNTEGFIFPESFAREQEKFRRIIQNLKKHPHDKIDWNTTIDSYMKKVEQLKSILRLDEFGAANNELLFSKMNHFLTVCQNPEYHIAFVGTIKTGKSTLINALLGKNYASTADSPETAALTKFRSSDEDYIKIVFYSKKEWEQLWASKPKGSTNFENEYNRLNANNVKDKWVGHETVTKTMENYKIQEEISKWTSSKYVEHLFVKEVEVGISDLNLPKQVVFVDTPGLGDPVAYRSEITRSYISNANVVFVCVNAKTFKDDEIDTLSSVFSFAGHNSNKVFVIGTHWDTFDAPVMNRWEMQKAYWINNYIVGPGFYKDEKTAAGQVFHSAANIYNLCRDVDTLGMDGKKTLMSKAFILLDNPSYDNKENSKALSDISNIDYIRDMISEKLVINYNKLLFEDIINDYRNIILDLKRNASDQRVEGIKVIEASNDSIEMLKTREEEEKKNLDKIQFYKNQLKASLDSVKNSTDKRLKELMPVLRKIEG